MDVETFNELYSVLGKRFKICVEQTGGLLRAD
jgi:hypothetical protein